MISKKDVEDYLDKMFQTEMNMHNIYTDSAKKIKDRKVKEIFEMVAGQEIEHAEEVKNLMNLLASLK